MAGATQAWRIAAFVDTRHKQMYKTIQGITGHSKDSEHYLKENTKQTHLSELSNALWISKWYPVSMGNSWHWWIIERPESNLPSVVQGWDGSCMDCSSDIGDRMRDAKGIYEE